MPIKRGNGGSRGLNKGLQKSLKVRPAPNDAWVVTHRNHSRTSAALAIAKLAQFIFNFITTAACAFHIVPMTCENGMYSLTNAKSRLFIHYCILLVLFARIANVMYACSGLIHEDFNMTTLLCLIALMFFLLCWSLGCSSILRSQDTVKLVNTWNQILGIVGEVGDRKVDMFEVMTLSVKVIGAGGSILLAPLVLPAVPFVYPQLPISTAHQIHQAFPDIPEIWFQLVCFPFELIAFLISALMAAFGVVVLIVSLELVNLYGHDLWKLPMNTPAQHQQMTRMYTCYKVYNAIVNTWYKFVTPSAFFMASGTIVVLLYITFRHTELPIYIYWFFPYAALATFFIVFGLCYDGLTVVNETEEVVGRLQSHHTKCFSRMSEEDRKAGLRWGKAIRPYIANVGIFTTFNIGVPLTMQLPQGGHADSNETRG